MNSPPNDTGLPSLEDMATKLRDLLANPPMAAESRIRLEVHGGVNSERYDLDFAVSPTGQAVVELTNELAGTRLEQESHDIPPEEVTELLTMLDAEALLSAAKAVIQIPPDSLVGRLVVEIDGETLEVVFMADQGQAEFAGAELPSSVARIVDKLYSMAEGATDTEGIRP